MLRPAPAGATPPWISATGRCSTRCWRAATSAWPRLARRPVGIARPGRPAHPAGGEPRRAGAGPLRQRLVAARRAPAPLLNANTRAGSEAQHPRALRSRQRLLPPLARSGHELLLGALRGRSAAAAAGGAGGQVPPHPARLAAGAPGQRVLEIGCGWGGFAELAARDGLAVHRHHAVARPARLGAGERMARAGLDDRARFSLTDYRDLRGRYDHIVSIEMFEAVGERWWPAWFAAVARVPGAGRARRGAEHHHPRRPLRALPRGTDFIQQIHLPGRHAAFAFPPSASRPGAPGWRCARPSPSAATTPAPWPNGRRTSRQPGRRSPASASTSASVACGASTSPTARLASPQARPTSSSSSWPTRDEALAAPADASRRTGAGVARGGAQRGRLAALGQRRNDLARLQALPRHAVGGGRGAARTSAAAGAGA
jgi:hypothetical protein